MAEDRLESFGIYKLACQLFDDFWHDAETIAQRTATLDCIIGGLTNTIVTIEKKTKS